MGTSGNKGQGAGWGWERAESSISLRASVAPGAHNSISTNRGSAGAVPELLELTWGQVQGLGFTLEVPEARTLLPLLLAWEVPAGQWRETVSPRTGRTWTLGNDDNSSSNNSSY